MSRWVSECVTEVSRFNVILYINKNHVIHTSSHPHHSHPKLAGGHIKIDAGRDDDDDDDDDERGGWFLGGMQGGG